jgi:hypothetical protein
MAQKGYWSEVTMSEREGKDRGEGGREKGRLIDNTNNDALGAMANKPNKTNNNQQIKQRVGLFVCLLDRYFHTFAQSNPSYYLA